MIKIDPLCNPPSFTVRSSKEYLTEYQDNLQRLASGSKCKWIGYKYMANNNIYELLGIKFCSYCGVFITATTPVVEHYRPKNRIDIRNHVTHPIDILKYSSRAINNNGYVFYGSDYENLLIACDACNSGKGRESSYIPDKTKAKHVKKSKLKYGKHNLFPICYKTSSKKAKKNQYQINKIIDNIDGEKPLLLNPYIDDYYDYYDFSNMIYYDSSSRNKVILIKPKLGLSKYKEKKAKVSINIYGLNRVDLCIARGKKYDEVNKIIQDIDLSICQYKSRRNDDNLNKIALGVDSYLSTLNKLTTGNHEISDFFFHKYYKRLHSELLSILPSKFSSTQLEDEILLELKNFVDHTLDLNKMLNVVSTYEIRRER